MLQEKEGNLDEKASPAPMVALLYMISSGFIFSLPWAAWQGIWVAGPAFSPAGVGAVLFLGVAC
jgi:hypothetical protein